MALIGKIREQVGLLVLIIALAILAFLLMDVFSGPGSFAQEQPTAGMVNGKPVDQQAYQNRVDQVLSQRQQQNPNLTDEQRLAVQRDAWDSYVKEMLVKDEYDKLGLTVTNEEVQDLFVGPRPHAALLNSPNFKNEAGVFDAEMVRNYERQLESPGPDADPTLVKKFVREWNTFKHDIKKDQQFKKYSSLLQKGVYIPEWFAQESNTNGGKSVDVEYVKIPYTAIDDSEISFTDSDLSSYLNNNRAEYEQLEPSNDIEYISFPIVASDLDRQNVQTKMNEMVTKFRSETNDSLFVRRHNTEIPYTGTYMRRNDVPLSKKDEVMSASVGQVVGPFTEGENMVAYKVVDRIFMADSVNIGHILVRTLTPNDNAAALAKIDSLKNAILAGADFEASAFASDDAASKENGGDLGWFNFRTIPQSSPVFFPSFKNAAFRAQVGELLTIRTPQGWHLVKIHDKKGNSPAVKMAIVSNPVVASTETSNAIFGEASQFIGANRTLETFRAAAAEKGYQVQPYKNLKQSDINIPGIGATDDIPYWAHSEKAGAISNVFRMDDKYVVAAVTKKRPAGMPSVEDVRLQLESAVINEKKAAQIASQIGSGTDLASIANTFGQTAQTAAGISFDAPSTALGPEPKVQAAVTSLEAGQISAPIAGQQGVFVVKCTNATAPAQTDLTAVKQTKALTMRSQLNPLEALKKSSEVEDLRYKSRSF